MKQITELTFLNQLARRSKLPVPEHAVAPLDRRTLKGLLEHWGKAVLKPDVLAGKRGKAGAIRILDDASRAQQQIQSLLHTQIAGRLPRAVYLTRYVPAEMEVYTAITYHTLFQGPSLTISLKGGVDIEEVEDRDKRTIPVDVYKGLDAYQASQILSDLKCPRRFIGPLSRCLVDYWDLFISSGMRLCEINPWRITPAGEIFVCDFKAVLDEANFKSRNLDITVPEYPETLTSFEEEMRELAASSHQGQIHVSDLGGNLVLPILFGGGASTIIIETLITSGGSPCFLSDFGGNPPYERMYRAASLCFRHHLKKSSLLLILGGKANNTLIDVTFQAIGDALVSFTEENGPVFLPVVIGRGGPRLVRGMTILKETLETLRLPYVIFGHDTPVTMVAEYAARLAKSVSEVKKK